MIEIKLYNHELESFIEFLYGLKLSGRESRMRVRFMNLLGEKYRLFKDEHEQLLFEHSRKNDDGSIKVKKLKGEEVADVLDEQAFNKDWMELLNEEVVIEQNETNKQMLLSIKDSVLNCEQEFEGDSAILHDRFCEIVEQIAYE